MGACLLCLRPSIFATCIIATTNRPLEEKVQRKEFREDLFLALHILPIVVPPLRERKEDIPLLAEHFRQRFVRQHGFETLPISSSALNAMQDHSWPGNVRELRNAIERAVILSGNGGALLLEHFGFLTVSSAEPVPAPPTATEEADALSEMEKRHIFAVLEKCGGNRTHAAARLDISIRTLRNKLREYKGDSEEESTEAKRKE